MAEDPPANRPLVPVTLDLLSRDEEMLNAVLKTDASPDAPVSEPTRLPSSVGDIGCDWYHHLKTMWRHEAGSAGLEVWKQKHREREAQLVELLRSVLLPDLLYQRLVEQAECHPNALLLIGVHTDHEQLDCLPLELLGQTDCGNGTQIVVWRRRGGSVDRRPALRLLVIRSAPIDAELPQNEEEVRAIGTYVAADRNGPGIGTEVRPNSTYDEFTGATRDFRPGVVHLAMHGTSTALKFDSPPSNDPIGYASLARYFGRQPSINTVVSTACLSAHPVVVCKERGVCFASEVVNLGVPAAIGMANVVTPRAAHVFSERLYTELARARPIAEAYAHAVLAIKNIREHDHLLWSVPVLYAKSNIIPFPSQSYLDLLDRLQSMIEGVEGLRRRLHQLPAMPRGEAGAICLDLEAIRQDLHELQTTELPGRQDLTAWQEQVEAQREQLNWLMPQVTSALHQGRGVEQMGWLLNVFDEVERLVADQYPIMVQR